MCNCSFKCCHCFNRAVSLAHFQNPNSNQYYQTEYFFVYPVQHKNMHEKISPFWKIHTLGNLWFPPWEKVSFFLFFLIIAILQTFFSKLQLLNEKVQIVRYKLRNVRGKKIRKMSQLPFSVAEINQKYSETVWKKVWIAIYKFIIVRKNLTVQTLLKSILIESHNYLVFYSVVKTGFHRNLSDGYFNKKRYFCTHICYILMF